MKLGSKILLLTISLVLFLGLLMVFIINTTLTKTLTAELNDRARVLTIYLAKESADELLTENKLRLQLRINNFKINSPDVEYIYILDIKNEVFVHTFQEGFPAELLPDEKDRVNSEAGNDYRILKTEVGEIYEFETAILRSHIGSMRIGFNTKDIIDRVSNTTELMLSIVFLVVILGGFIAYFISARLSKPLAKLAEAAQIVGGGNTEHRVENRSNDEVVFLSASFNKMADDMGKVIDHRDEEIRERKQTQAKLHSSEARFRSVAESAIDAIIYIDVHGKIKFSNTAAADIFGYSSDEMLDRPVTIIIPERFREAHTIGIERSFNQGHSSAVGKIVELVGLRIDGSEFPLEMSLSTWETGNEIYFTSIIRDITDRKQAEEVIKNQVSRLSTLRSIDKAINASVDLDVTLEVLLTHVKTGLEIDAASVLLCNPDTRLLEYRASIGFRTNALKYTRLKMGESNAGQAALKRNIVSIPNLNEATTGFERSELFSNECFISYFAIPLIAKGVVLGVIEIFHRSQFDLEPEKLEFLESIATQGALALDNSFLFENLQSSNVELSMAYDRTLEGWSRALDMRDKETEGHSQRVTDLTVRIAQEFQIKGVELQNIWRGALLHDIGKMGIPDHILLKPGKLTDEEWTIMKLHPVYARDLLYPIEFLRPAIDIPYYHHEKWDGSGYPKGLKGVEIPLSARIFAIVDVWDALRSDRPYRAAWPTDKTIEHIGSLVGSHFDPAVAELFLSHVRKHEEAEVGA